MYSQITSNKRKSVLLIVVFVGVILLLGWLFDQYSGESGGIGIAIIVSFLATLLSYFAGDKIALSVSRAEPIAKEQNPYLYRMVENLCITAGLPLPKIYIIQDTAINAFATGRDPTHASIAVTRGALDQLENEELEGVLAHELSHIKNYDVRFMMLVVVLVGAIGIMSYWFRHILFFGGRRSNNRRGADPLIIIGIVLAILSPLIAELIKLAVSRKREFLADASGSLLTRYPEGLASALEKLQQDHTPMRQANHATAHLWLDDPYQGKEPKISWITKIFMTHPPIEERIKRLRALQI